MSNIEDTLQKETLRETKIDLKTLQPELFQKYNYRGGYGTVSKKKVFYSVSLSIVAAFFLQNIGTYYGKKLGGGKKADTSSPEWRKATELKEQQENRHVISQHKKGQPVIIHSQKENK